MSYLNIISLSQAKTYLRIDEDQNETDIEIISMIEGCLSFIEKRTNHILFPRDKIYYADNIANVYDFPINTIPSTSVQLIYSTYSSITTFNRSVLLNVGYINVSDVPEELRQAALQMLKVFYFEAEKQVNTSLIPMAVLMLLDINKRYIC
jgi:hypothetical protein